MCKETKQESSSINGVAYTRRDEKQNHPVFHDANSVKDLCANINQPQALKDNLATLAKQGGIDGLLTILGSNADSGIPTATVQTRRELFGCNSLPSKAPASFWSLFKDTFDDATLQILIASAIVSLVVGMYDDPSTGYIEGVAILMAVLVVSIVTAINDYSKERQFRELSAANDDVNVLVIRNGVATQIKTDQLVVGDVVCIEAGDLIPCDGVILAGDGLAVDESALTGEPDDVTKGKSDPFVLSGCIATSGSAQFLAIAVGKDSQWGVIKAHLEKEHEITPLQEKLDDMAALIGYVGMGAAALTFIAMMAIKIYIQPEHLQDVTLFSHALDAFIICVTVLVVAIPEGLPLAVTISLAYSTKKMLQDQNLIRHLAACETMGNATNICSDKTGTLTENRMTVVKGVFANSMAGPSNAKTREVILECIACCSTARVLQKQDQERPVVIGNKTEAALLMLAKQWGDDPGTRRTEARFGKPGGSRLFPFSSARKRMSVLVNKNPTQKQRVTRSSSIKQWTLYHKGAAETLLQDCTTYLDVNGSEQSLSQAKRREFENIISQYASEALRCVALCHKRQVQNDNTDFATLQDSSHLEQSLCLDAIVGIADPLRADVVDAVSTCQHAGIFVRMITGDNLETANAIARQAGILTEGGLSMVGEDFRKLTPAQLDEILPRLQVVARSSPEDKHLLVQRLNGAHMPETEEEWLEAHPGKSYEKERNLLLPGYKQEWLASHRAGEVVGVTGDGTNDGPALKSADVGLSMGITGTDVAKKASDIIIMDDKFSSIIKAVLWGRSVFDNIRKFLQFQLTVNVVALTITFLSAVAGYKPPLNAVMMLWVNLIMDTMGALALGTEPPAKELLDRRPYRRDASLISLPMWRNILVQATFQLGVLVFLLNQGPQIFGCEDGSTHHFTLIFNAFVFCQVFNEFNAREIGDRFNPFHKLVESPVFLFVIVFTILAQCAIVQYGGDFTQTYPLTWNEWKVTSLLGSLSIPFGYAMRQIPIEEAPSSFAGLERNDQPVGFKKKYSVLLGTFVLVLVPIFAALVYELVVEAEEFIEHEHVQNEVVYHVETSHFHQTHSGSAN